MTGPLHKIRRILKEAAAGRTAASAYIGYLVVERIGLFRVLPATWREAFHSLPSRLLSLVFVLFAVTGIVAALREAKGRERAGRILCSGAVILLSVGLWTSYYTRFEGKAFRAEGESFNAFPSDYVRESVFRARYAKVPQVGISILKLAPETAEDPMQLKRVDASILFASRTTQRVREGKLSSRWPLVSDWTVIGITDFGYMPTYVLSDRAERMLESNTVYQKLYPPGAEEYFRTQFLGYLFYVRCYPDYIDLQGRPGSVSAVPRNPVFNLRIVRNKDIVYNGLVKPTEKVRFDNVVIALPDVKMWVEISLVRDLGLPVVALGFVVLLAGGVLLYGKGGRRATTQ